VPTSKLYRQCANTGIATDSARVNRGDSLARLITRMSPAVYRAAIARIVERVDDSLRPTNAPLVLRLVET
jgi:hypothetical protein